MSTTNFSACEIVDALKNDKRDILGCFIRQATGNDPFLTISNSDNSSFPWTELLKAVELQGDEFFDILLESFKDKDCSSWPLFHKLRIDKCQKCSKEFCSLINYRRHTYIHSKQHKFDKDSMVARNLLSSFWDKLSTDKAKHILSFKNISLEDVTGSSILKDLTLFVSKPMVSSLHEIYVKAGSSLLDIIQSKGRIFLPSSRELFSVLEDASEGTFLHVTALSLQKYIFDCVAGKIGLDIKNSVAYISFILEKKLLEVWVADKDAEALMCQKLLVDEEEAARKRMDNLVEKRRQKKQRQREHKSRELQPVLEKDYLKDEMDNSTDIPFIQTRPPPSSTTSNSDSRNPSSIPSETPVSFSVPVPLPHTSEREAEMGDFFVVRRNGNGRVAYTNPRPPPISNPRQLVKFQRGPPLNGFHNTQKTNVLKYPVYLKQQNVVGSSHSKPPPPLFSNGKINNKDWPSKLMPHNPGRMTAQRTPASRCKPIRSCYIMVGSIPVPLGNCQIKTNKNKHFVIAPVSAPTFASALVNGRRKTTVLNAIPCCKRSVVNKCGPEGRPPTEPPFFSTNEKATRRLTCGDGLTGPNISAFLSERWKRATGDGT